MTPEEEIAALKARVAELETMLGLTTRSPSAFGLTRREAQIAGLLYRRPQVARDQLMVALYGHLIVAPDPRVIDVYAVRLRKKLKPFGIEIKTIWGIGYCMDFGSKQAFSEYLAIEEERYELLSSA